jgi:hypothetical protein
MKILKILLIIQICLLAGCASLPQQKFDSTRHREIDSMNVRKVREIDSLSYYVVHRVGDSFGFIGSLASSVSVANKGKTFNNAMKDHMVDFSAKFDESLKEQLALKGYKVNSIKVLEEDTKNGFMVEYSEESPTLDVRLAYFGYHSQSGKVYSPGIFVTVKLVSDKGKDLLFAETYLYGKDSSMKKVKFIESSDEYDLMGFNELESNPEIVLQGLLSGIDRVSMAIAEDLKKN